MWNDKSYLMNLMINLIKEYALHKFSKFVIKLFFLISLMSCFSSQKVFAESNNNLQAAMPQLTILNNEPGFTRSTNTGFFDFEFKPGEKVILGVRIHNLVNKKIILVITPGTVITNQGHIVFGDQSNQMIDQSNKYPFSKMVSKQKVSVDPNATKIVKIPVNVPTEKFNGTILGNLAFTVLGQNQSDDSNNQKNVATINNIVRQALIVKMRQGVQPEPDFDIGLPATGGTIQEPVFTVPVRNIAATYFKEDAKTKVIYTVTKKNDSKIKYVAQDNNISMAPNSFYYGIIPTKGKAIQPGKYHMEVEIKYRNKNVKLNRNFEVTKAQSRNPTAKAKINKPKSQFPFWIVLLIFLVILILLVALFAGISKGRRKKLKKISNVKSNSRVHLRSRR